VSILHLGLIFATAELRCPVLGIFDTELFCLFSLHVMQVLIILSLSIAFRYYLNNGSSEPPIFLNFPLIFRSQSPISLNFSLFSSFFA